MKILKKIRAFIKTVRTEDIKKILKSKWVIFGVGPLFTLVGAGLVILMGHFLTTHPAICLSCHARQTSLSMWASSAVHPEDVTCANCHAKVGRFFPRDFFADERVNENCLGCHKQVGVKGMETAHHVKIAHKIHIEESKLVCIDCHRNIAHEKVETGTNRPRRLTCSECHEEAISGGPESCMKCHIKIPVTSAS